MDDESTGYHQPAILAERRAAKVAKARPITPLHTPPAYVEQDELPAGESFLLNAAIFLACVGFVGAIGWWILG